MAYEIPNEPFRRAFLANDMTAGEVAMQAGWTRKQVEKRPNRRAGVRIVGDSSRVMRAIGLAKRDGKLRDTLSESEAMALLPAFPSLDPVDVDL